MYSILWQKRGVGGCAPNAPSPQGPPLPINWQSSTLSLSWQVPFHLLVEPHWQAAVLILESVHHPHFTPSANALAGQGVRNLGGIFTTCAHSTETAWYAFLWSIHNSIVEAKNCLLNWCLQLWSEQSVEIIWRRLGPDMICLKFHSEKWLWSKVKMENHYTLCSCKPWRLHVHISTASCGQVHKYCLLAVQVWILYIMYFIYFEFEVTCLQAAHKMCGEPSTECSSEQPQCSTHGQRLREHCPKFPCHSILQCWWLPYEVIWED